MSADLRHQSEIILAFFVVLRRTVSLVVHSDLSMGMKTQSKHDALSRRPDHMKNMVSFNHMQLKDPGINNQIQDGYRSDEWAQTIINSISTSLKPKNTRAKIQLPSYKYQKLLLCWKGNGNCSLYVPSAGDLHQSIIYDFHKTGHLGLDKTYSNLRYRNVTLREYSMYKNIRCNYRFAKCYSSSKSPVPNIQH